MEMENEKTLKVMLMWKDKEEETEKEITEKEITEKED
jgi:hypothetical protein